MSTLAINDLQRHVASLRGELDAALQRVLDRGWFVLGPEVAAFETEFAAWCGAAHCVGVANGTDALELAIRSLGLGNGDLVACVANAGFYAPSAMIAAGCVPFFVDVDPDTLVMDPRSLADAVQRERVKAVVVTHLYGRLANITDILGVARSVGVPVIEDCAQAHGASDGDGRAGTFGDVSCFSFYPTKNLGALGDGGAIVTSQRHLADRVRLLRQYGWSSKYHASEPFGRNSRLDEMQAAILRAKLPYLDAWNARRREIATRYSEGIRHPRVRVPRGVVAPSYVGHLYVVRVEADARGRLRTHLQQRGVGSDIHYPLPDHRQQALRGPVRETSLPVTELACREVLTLPCFPELDDTEVDQVIDAVNAW